MCSANTFSLTLKGELQSKKRLVILMLLHFELKLQTLKRVLDSIHFRVGCDIDRYLSLVSSFSPLHVQLALTLSIILIKHNLGSFEFLSVVGEEVQQER